MLGFKAFIMNKKFLMKTGIALIVVASLGFVMIKNNKTDKLPENNVELEVEDNELENTYLDDNYEMPDDVDLNEEFENRVESEKNNQSDDSSQKNDSNTSSNTGNSSAEEDNDEDNKDNEEDNKDNEDENSSSEINTNKKTGLFQGFADDNSVEIKIGNEYATYRVSSQAKSTLSNKNLGESITFEFTKENGQLIITSVK